MAQLQRTRSIWKLNQGLRESIGITGQYGREQAITYADQATAAIKSIWQTPNTIPGRAAARATRDPMPLPIPNPTRNTASTMENV